MKIQIALCLGLSLVATTRSVAQEGPQSGDSAQLAEILVTAEKRSEDLSRVPLSVSALSAQDVQALHVENFSDLSRAIPNVSFSSEGGPGLSTIEIRGISSQAGTAAIGIYMDDVSLTTRNLYSQGTEEPRFFDLNRVEVLRGPQGTLYGGGALGGVIRFIGNQPNLHEFGGTSYMEASQTTHGSTSYNGNAVLNLPMIDGKLALRIGAQRGEDAGYVDLVSPNDGHIITKGSNSNKWTVVRAALKWQVTEAWSVTPSVFYQKMESADIDAFSLAPFTNPVKGTVATVSGLQAAKWLREPGTDTLSVPNLVVEADLGFANLTAVASYYKRNFDRVQDGTTVNLPYLISLYPAGSSVATGLDGLNSAVDLQTAQEQSALELRLASTPYDPSAQVPITWVAGAFASSDKTDVWDNEPIPGIGALFTHLGLNINDPGAFGGTNFPGAWPASDVSYYSHRSYNPRRRALFGELNYYFRPDLHATFGVRYESAKEDFDRQGNFYYSGCGGPATCPLTVSPPTASFTATTPRVSLTWDINENNMAFANVAKGYRLGSFNRPVPLYGTPSSPGSLQDLQSLGLCNGTVTGCARVIPVSIQPDWSWSYELGSKSRLLDNRLQLNASVYYTKWNNTQQDLNLVTSFYDFETNVGHVKTYGAELEIKGLVTRELTLELSGGVTNSTFNEDLPALGYSNGLLNVAKGARVPGAPDFNARAGAEYGYHYTAMVAGFVRTDLEATGTSHGTVVEAAPDYRRPGYATWDASSGISWASFDLTLFGKNLCNEQKVLQRPNVQSVNEGFTLRPRTVGLGLNYRFGGG